MAPAVLLDGGIDEKDDRNKFDQNKYNFVSIVQKKKKKKIRWMKIMWLK